MEEDILKSNNEDLIKQEIIKVFPEQAIDELYFVDKREGNYTFKTITEDIVYKVINKGDEVIVKRIDELSIKTPKLKRLLARTIDYLLTYVLYIIVIIYMVFLIRDQEFKFVPLFPLIMSYILIVERTIFFWININNRTIGGLILGVYKVSTNYDQLTQQEYKNEIYYWPIIFPFLYPIMIVMILLGKDVWNGNTKYIDQQTYDEVIEENEFLMKYDRPLKIAKSIHGTALLTLFALIIFNIFYFNLTNIIISIPLFLLCTIGGAITKDKANKVQNEIDRKYRVEKEEE